MKTRKPLRKQPGQKKLKRKKGDPNGNKTPNFINREEHEQYLTERCTRFLEQKNINTQGMSLKDLIDTVLQTSDYHYRKSY